MSAQGWDDRAWPTPSSSHLDLDQQAFTELCADMAGNNFSWGKFALTRDKQQLRQQGAELMETAEGAEGRIEKTDDSD